MIININFQFHSGANTIMNIKIHFTSVFVRAQTICPVAGAFQKPCPFQQI